MDKNQIIGKYQIINVMARICESKNQVAKLTLFFYKWQGFQKILKKIVNPYSNYRKTKFLYRQVII